MKKIILIFIFILTEIFLCFSQSYVWTGASNDNWSDQLNWRLNPSDGSDGNDGFPNGVGDNATINAGGTPLLSTPITLNTLTNTGGTIDIAGNNLNIIGTYTNSGTIMRYGGTTGILSAPTYNENGTQIYYGSGGAIETRTGTDYNILVFLDTFTYTVAGGNLTTGNNLNISTDSTLQITGGNLTVGGSFNNLGWFERNAGYTCPTDTNSGVITYIGTGGAIQDYGAADYNILEINSTGQTFTMSSALTIASNFAIIAGALSTGANSITISGNAIIDGTINTGSQGSANTTNITGGLFNSTGDGSTGTFTGGAGAINIGGNLNLNNFTATSGITTVNGATITLHTFSHNNGIFMLNSGNQSLITNNQVFNNLRKNDAGTVTITNNLTTAGNFRTNLVNSVFDINGNNLSVNTLLNTGIIIMDGNEASVTITNMDSANGIVRYDGVGGTVKNLIYYNLEITGSVSLLAATTVNNNITIGTGAALDGDGFRINAGGAWTNNGGTFTPAGSIVRFFSYLTNNPVINAESGFDSLIIDAVTKTTTISGNVTCSYLALYNGALTFSGAYNLHTTGDFIGLGNSLPINSLTVDGWSGPARVIDPGSYTGSFNAASSGCTLQVDNNFYVNGCNMTGASNWNLTLQDNNNQTVRNTRAYGGITVSHSQANFWVSASEDNATNHPADGGNNTNWDFGLPTVVFASVFDNVVRVTCTSLIENSNNEISASFASIRYNNNTVAFSGSFTDIACTTSTDGADDLGTFYLKANGTDTWNTDATGASLGGADSTDRSGTHQTRRPDITMAEGVLRNSRKNQCASLTNYNTQDICQPILLTAVINNIETDGTNTFNSLTLTFSEPILSPGVNTTNQVSDGIVNISTGGRGGALVSAGSLVGWGEAAVSGTIITHANNENTVRSNATKRNFIIRLGGNTASGGSIYSDSPPTYTQISGAFTPETNLRDNNNNQIDTSVTPNITITNNWTLIPPDFSTCDTNERASNINGWIDNLIIDFDRAVNIYDGGVGFGTSSVVWGAVTYAVSNINGSNSITSNYNLNLTENTINFTVGDTDSTPTVTYDNGSAYKIIANSGRVEMADGTNIVSSDYCNPVITAVVFSIDDPLITFNPSPYYTQTTGTYSNPGAGTFNMYDPSDTSLPEIQRTYHNTIRFEFSEPINNFNGVPVDQQSGNYDFNMTQRSNAALCNFNTGGGVVTVIGLGSFTGNITVDANNNFIQRETNRTTYLHVAGFFDSGEFPGHITNTGVITVPNSSGTYYFTTIVNVNIIDNAGLSLIAKSLGGSSAVQISFDKDWDVYPPNFRLNTFSDPPNFNKGAFIDSNPDRLEFVMTEAIRDPIDFDMNAFSFIFHNKSISITTARTFVTTTSRLGRYTNDASHPVLDGDVNDQGFSVTFGNQSGDNTQELIDWTYNPTTKFITDLRGNRLQSVLISGTSLNMMPPIIKQTRIAVGDNRMYVEFNKPVYHAGGTPILFSDFSIGPEAISVQSISSISGTNNTQYIFTLNSNLDQNQIVDNLINCNLNTIEDIFNNTMDNSIMYPLSFIGINFFVNMTMEDYIHGDTQMQVTNFDGSQRITAEGILLRVRILDVTSFAGYKPVIYYDVLGNHNQNSFWYPNENSNARMVTGINSGVNIWEFMIPSNDDELKSGNELSFVFRYGSLYCYRSKYVITSSKFNPRDAETYMVKIQKILTQNSNVTIINNVINPNKNEETKLIYTLEKAGPVSIVVYDLAGEMVCVLKQGSESKGQHSVSWNGRNNNGKIVARGVYFIRVRAPGIYNQIRKVLVIK